MTEPFPNELRFIILDKISNLLSESVDPEGDFTSSNRQPKYGPSVIYYCLKHYQTVRFFDVNEFVVV